MNNIKLCSGDGKYHTDRTSPLNAVDWDDITRLVENPQNVPKEDATWLIPSSLLSRDAKNQEKKGEYLALWVDIDHAPPQISVVAGVIGGIIDGCCSEVYTSKSATKEKPKSRGIIPLDKLLTPTEWLACQEILNDKLKDVGITPDRHNERLNQIFYLPNKGEYYDRQSNRGGPFFDPLAAFSEELTAMQETKELAKAKRANTGLDFNAPISFSNSTSSYGKTALEGECSVLAIAPQGSRNEQLNKATFSIAQLIAGGEISDPEGYAVLEQTAISCGLSADEIKQTLASGFEAGIQEPRSAPSKDGGINPVDNSVPKASAQERLQAFTANGLSGDMKRQMLDEKYVVDGIALLGQWTTIYASPNSGKTLIILHELMKSVSNGVIKGDDVFYANVDDSYNGQTDKLELLEEVGIQVLIPNQRGFKANALLPLMEELTNEGTAKEKIFILDTMKKFTDLMNKSVATSFGNVARGFAQAGGTLICLAHTNKHKDAEGKSVHAGTSDVVDDCDCAYIIDASAPDPSGQRRAMFNNIKNRGNVALEITFEYTKIEGGDYEALLNSVKRLDDKGVKVADKEAKLLNDIEEAKPLVDEILSALEDGGLNAKELETIVKDRTSFPRASIKKAIIQWRGDDYAAGHRWTVRKVRKNELLYQQLVNPMDTTGETMLDIARLRRILKT